MSLAQWKSNYSSEQYACLTCHSSCSVALFPSSSGTRLVVVLTSKQYIAYTITRVHDDLILYSGRTDPKIQNRQNPPHVLK